jgi:hypothetical protein
VAVVEHFQSRTAAMRMAEWLCREPVTEAAKENGVWKSGETGLFGRASAPAPRAAPTGALPNSGNCTSSGCGAGAGAPRGFQRGGGVTFWWLHLAPTRNPPEELFCQTFFKTTQLHQTGPTTSSLNKHFLGRLFFYGLVESNPI